MHVRIVATVQKKTNKKNIIKVHKRFDQKVRPTMPRSPTTDWLQYFYII